MDTGEQHVLHEYSDLVWKMETTINMYIQTNYVVMTHIVKCAVNINIMEVNK